jgi:hypothetical protein
MIRNHGNINGNNNGIFLNIATNPYSNYTWCGDNGSTIFESPYDCPIRGYDYRWGVLIFDENAGKMSTITSYSFY